MSTQEELETAPVLDPQSIVGIESSTFRVPVKDDLQLYVKKWVRSSVSA